MLRRIIVALLLVAVSFPAGAQILTTRNGSVSTSVVKKKTTVEFYPSGWEIGVLGSIKSLSGSTGSYYIYRGSILPIIGASCVYRKIKGFPDGSGSWGYCLGGDISFFSANLDWAEKGYKNKVSYHHARTSYLTLGPKASVFFGGKKWTLEAFLCPEVNYMDGVGLEFGPGLRYRPSKALSIFLDLSIEFTGLRAEIDNKKCRDSVSLIGPSFGLTFHL